MRTTERKKRRSNVGRKFPWHFSLSCSTSSSSSSFLYFARYSIHSTFSLSSSSSFKPFHCFHLAVMTKNYCIASNRNWFNFGNCFEITGILGEYRFIFGWNFSPVFCFPLHSSKPKDVQFVLREKEHGHFNRSIRIMATHTLWLLLTVANDFSISAKHNCGYKIELG